MEQLLLLIPSRIVWFEILSEMKTEIGYLHFRKWYIYNNVSFFTQIQVVKTNISLVTIYHKIKINSSLMKQNIAVKSITVTSQGETREGTKGPKK